MGRQGLSGGTVSLLESDSYEVLQCLINLHSTFKAHWNAVMDRYQAVQ